MSKSIYREEHRTLLSLVREGRESRGMTQADVAEKIGLTQARVSDLERGGRRMDVLEYLDYCAAIGLDPIATLRRVVETAKKRV